MEEQKASYYGIMPAPVRYNNDLSSSEKLMYCEITALSNKCGYCHAGNQYFANLYDVTKQTVSGWFRSLKDVGLIEIEYIKDGRQITERRAYPLMDKFGRYYEKDEYPIKEKVNTPIKKNPKGNTTSNNTTSNNKGRIPEIEDVVDYFVEHGYSKSAAQTMYNYYETSIEDMQNPKYWRDSRGNKIKNWKMKAQSVWFKPENKSDNSNGQIYAAL